MKRTLLVSTVVLMAAAFLTVGLFSAETAFADEGGIEVVSSGAESQFPDGVIFSITAKSSEEIDDIRVFFRKAEQTGVSAYRTVDFEPGKLVNGESFLKATGGGNFFPPGTRIAFSFEIRDHEGSVVRTPEQEFVYIDNRFEWLTVNSGLITVYYYGEYVEQRAKTVLDAAEKAMERMVPLLGIEPTTPLQIVSYNNYRHMSAALPFRSQAVREQLQTQGMAFTDERVLLVHGFDSTVKGTTSHEFTHLLVAEAAGSAISRVPAWLNEGLAEYGNIDQTDSYDAALRYGIYTRRIRPLWYLDSFGGTPDDIVIAYGQGKSVVNFLVAKYGPDKMAELFRVLQQTLDIDSAMDQVYGVDQYGLDTQWRLAVGIEPLPSPEELERQLLQDSAQAESADTGGESDVVPGADADSPMVDGSEEEGAGGPGPSPSPVHEPTAVAVTGTTPEETGDEDPTTPASPGGCSAPVPGTGSASLSLGSLLLLASPLGMLSFRVWRRRRDR